MRRFVIALLASLAVLGLSATVASAALPASFEGDLHWSGAQGHTVGGFGGGTTVAVERPMCTGSFQGTLTLHHHSLAGQCLEGRWTGQTTWPGPVGEIRAHLTDPAGAVGEMVFVPRVVDACRNLLFLPLACLELRNFRLERVS